MDPTKVVVRAMGFGRSGKVTTCLLLAVWRLACRLKLDAGSWLERSGAPVTQNVRNSQKYGGPGVPLGAPWDSEGLAREVRNHLGDGLGVCLGSVGPSFYNIFKKSVICSFRCHSRTEVLLEQVQAPKLEALRAKSHARTVQSDVEGASQSGKDSQVWLFGLAVNVMQLTGNQPRSKSRPGKA